MPGINDYMPLSHDWNMERLEKLKALFPDLFTSEGQLSIDELKKVIDPQSVTETERYVGVVPQQILFHHLAIL